MEINGKTKVVGIIGWPVSHSLSPLMHNAAFCHLGLNYCYIPLPVAPEKIGEAVRGLEALGFVGANVTIPHKEAVIPYLAELDVGAELTGAVNTIVRTPAGLKGYNTDVDGFLRSLKEDLGYVPVGKKVVILGAGGAARAAVVALALAGAAAIVVLNRNPERGRALCELLAPRLRERGWQGELAAFPLPPEDGEKVFQGANLLVNATPAGMEGFAAELPLPLEQFPEDLVVYDMVYNPPLTPLLQECRRRGLKAVNGLGMLLYQGAAAFTLWTGREAPVEIMASVLAKQVKNQ